MIKSLWFFKGYRKTNVIFEIST